MQRLMDWYYTEGENLHPVERAVMLHNECVRIHPFVDGNGRTAPLLLNLELMRNGYVPIIIKVDDRQAYYDALDEYGTTRDARAFIGLKSWKRKHCKCICFLQEKSKSSRTRNTLCGKGGG